MIEPRGRANQGRPLSDARHSDVVSVLGAAEADLLRTRTPGRDDHAALIHVSDKTKPLARERLDQPLLLPAIPDCNASAVEPRRERRLRDDTPFPHGG